MSMPCGCGEEVMAVVGVFDGVHRGHRWLLAEASAKATEERCRLLMVTFGSHPLEVVRPEAAPQMLMSVEERCEKLRQSASGRVVVLDFDKAMSRLTAGEFMKMLRDDYGVTAMYMGFNHRFGSDRLTATADYDRIGEELGLKIFHGEEYRGVDGSKVSSSKIREALQSGNVEWAAWALGREYRLDGTVVSGQQLGRTIGFPTANISVDRRRLRPMTGVYACVATLPGGDEYAAMVNIGSRPTVDAEGALITVEANLLDYAGDLYGREISIDFIKKMRDEQKFDSLDALKGQLATDAMATRSVIASLSRRSAK